MRSSGSPRPLAESGLAIETRDLSRRYGDAWALRDLSLSVRAGEVFGFLGPNGAGKTTTVKILLGLAAPTEGTARLFGRPVQDRLARREVGYLPEMFRFHEWMTGAELLDFHGRLVGIGGADRRARIERVLSQVGLGERGSDRIATYSKGMTQRLGLAQAMLARPRLVILDEPTSALDPLGRREVRDIIRDLRNDGCAVFLNSHLLTEVEMVCDRVAIVDRGRVTWEGTPRDVATPRLEIDVTVEQIDDGVATLLAQFGTIVQTQGTTVRVRANDASASGKIAAAIVAAGYVLTALEPRRWTLEDLFVRLVTGSDG